MSQRVQPTGRGTSRKTHESKRMCRTSGQYNTRQSKTRQDNIGQFRQGKARQDKTKQDNIGQYRQGKARQDKTKQDNIGQYKTRQGNTRQSKTRQNKTSQYKTRQYTRQYKTIYDKTRQDNARQCKTVQYSLDVHKAYVFPRGFVGHLLQRPTPQERQRAEDKTKQNKTRSDHSQQSSASYAGLPGGPVAKPLSVGD